MLGGLTTNMAACILRPVCSRKRLLRWLQCPAGPGAHDLLKIQLSQTMLQTRSKRTTMLLPFVKEFVPLIDVEDNVIHVCPPAGLVDMALNPTVKSKLAAKDKRGPQTQ